MQEDDPTIKGDLTNRKIILGKFWENFSFLIAFGDIYFPNNTYGLVNAGFVHQDWA